MGGHMFRNPEFNTALVLLTVALMFYTRKYGPIIKLPNWGHHILKILLIIIMLHFIYSMLII